MFKAYVLKRRTLLRFVLFVAIVSALAAYADSRREAFRRSALEHEKAVPAASANTAPPAQEEQGHGPRTVDDAKDGFFFSSRQQRDKAYAMEMEALRQVAEDPDADQGLRSEAARKLLLLTESLAGERRAEEMIRARGFEDALVFSTEEGATVIVKSGPFDKTMAAQVGDVVINVLKAKPEKVNIVARD